MEQGASTPRADWGSLPSLLLKHVGELMRKNGVDVLPVIKSARLVNSHWCLCASELVTELICSSQVPLEQMSVKIPSSFTRVQKLWFRQGVKPNVAPCAPHRRRATRGRCAPRPLNVSPPRAGATFEECCGGDHSLACLQELNYMTHLDIGRIKITDSDLEHLVGLTSLRRLDLRMCTLISDAGLAQVARMSSLTHLEISEGSLARVARLICPHLEVDPCEKRITNDGLLWLAQLTCLEHLRLQRLLDITAEGLAHLTTLTCLKYLGLLGLRYIESNSVVQVGALTGLEELEVDFCQNGVHLQGLHQLTGLQKLAIETCGRYLAAIGVLTNLKFLCIGDSMAQPLRDEVWLAVKKLEGLEHLRLQRIWSLPFQSWAHIGMLKSLKTLSFINDPDGSEDTTVPCEHLTGLECLDLNVNWNANGRMTRTLSGAELLTNLRCLGLSHNVQLSDEALLHVGELIGLKHLYLAGCWQITDAGVAHLTKLTALEVLNLSGCQKVTNRALVYVRELGALRHLSLSTHDGTTQGPFMLAEGLAALEQFDLYGVGYITDGIVAEVERLSFRMRMYLHDADGKRLMKTNG
ncbi:unnamed protein product [Ostreobium quekettii]|uniref:Disease resistance R13L4/SHOC-2-like LRR domain-containing protein n=1 Tax=Ostreobium quekettii TaxID=121088 RepID=A0A8S1JD43_9CHLO|nr:unnamed protein product [Ostreobium quekettii]|eukprot:evm.model.scf_23.5 EVM.evm.TU.scf_23.5   scf_23:37108-39152(+)